MIYGYIRVSTDKQTTENQAFEIKRFSEKNNVSIDRWIKETISSRADLNKRKLGGLLKRLKKGDVVIASELSRFGRNLLQVMSLLHFFMNRGVQVWTIKDNYRLGTDIQSKVLAFAFGLSAEIERNLISQRTREALLRLKSEGRVLGRPKGKKNKVVKLTGKEAEIKRMINLGDVSREKMARAVGCHRTTLYNYLVSHNITTKPLKNTKETTSFSGKMN